MWHSDIAVSQALRPFADLSMARSGVTGAPPVRACSRDHTETMCFKGKKKRKALEVKRCAWRLLFTRAIRSCSAFVETRREGNCSVRQLFITPLAWTISKIFWAGEFVRRLATSLNLFRGYVEKCFKVLSDKAPLTSFYKFWLSMRIRLSLKKAVKYLWRPLLYSLGRVVGC